MSNWTKFGETTMQTDKKVVRGPSKQQKENKKKQLWQISHDTV